MSVMLGICGKSVQAGGSLGHFLYVLGEIAKARLFERHFGQQISKTQHGIDKIFKNT